MASRALSPSDGEIVDSDSDKPRSRSPSQLASSRYRAGKHVRYSRSPSPTSARQPPRYGSKRERDDDRYYDRRRAHDRYDGRQYGRSDQQRANSRQRQKRRRSRSPPQIHDRRQTHERPVPHGRFKHDRAPSVSNQSEALSATTISGANAEHDMTQLQQAEDSGDMLDVKSIVDESTSAMDVELLREQKKRRWKSIQDRHRSQSSTPLLLQALGSPANTGSESAPATPNSPNSRSSTPMDFSKDSELAHSATALDSRDDSTAAADYDPRMDMEQDKLKQDQRLASNATRDGHIQNGAPTLASEQPTKDNDHEEFDMFADDDDMFTASPPAKMKATQALNVDTIDDWDDEEGYYKVILGELLDGRYHVQSNLGRGMFSGVVRAQDRVTEKLVAIKLIRNNETMRKAAAKEIGILEKLKAADLDDKRHVVRLERSFEHKGHLCMVFENLHENLREVLKKFGRDIGIELQAVRVYAQQMFKGLGLLRRCNILHADLKPDNILVNERRNWLKICDLGSASDASDNDITPYLVSRFYRAPEIILGMPYDFGIDTWSIGCTLYELYTGKILFTGRSNNQMLRGFMECRGRIPTRMLKRSAFAYLHFDETGIFRSVEKDKVTGADVVRMQNYLKPTKDLRARLSTKGMNDSETRDLNLFIDFLDKCLVLNPEKRLTPEDALKHPFLLKSRT